MHILEKSKSRFLAPNPFQEPPRAEGGWRWAAPTPGLTHPTAPRWTLPAVGRLWATHQSHAAATATPRLSTCRCLLLFTLSRHRQLQAAASPCEIAYLHSPDAPEISKNAEKRKKEKASWYLSCISRYSGDFFSAEAERCRLWAGSSRSLSTGTASPALTLQLFRRSGTGLWLRAEVRRGALQIRSNPTMPVGGKRLEAAPRRTLCPRSSLAWKAGSLLLGRAPETSRARPRLSQPARDCPAIAVPAAKRQTPPGEVRREQVGAW